MDVIDHSFIGSWYEMEYLIDKEILKRIGPIDKTILVCNEFYQEQLVVERRTRSNNNLWRFIFPQDTWRVNDKPHRLSGPATWSAYDDLANAGRGMWWQIHGRSVAKWRRLFLANENDILNFIEESEDLDRAERLYTIYHLAQGGAIRVSPEFAENIQMMI